MLCPGTRGGACPTAPGARALSAVLKHPAAWGPGTGLASPRTEWGGGGSKAHTQKEGRAEAAGESQVQVVTEAPDLLLPKGGEGGLSPSPHPRPH